MPENRSQRQLVVFSLGREEYALPIEQVQEIVRYSEPRPVSGAAPGVRGVISVRGTEVAACDIASVLGIATEPADATKIVVVATQAGTAGVIVDDVVEVLTIEADHVAGAGAVQAGARGMTLLDADVMLGSIPFEAVA